MDDSKDWIIQLGVRPNAMNPIDPPKDYSNENDHRLFPSIYSMTLAECFLSHEIADYLHEHIQLEKECSNEEHLPIIWSDDVSLTLCFLSSLAHHGDYQRDHLLQRIFQWWMNGYMCPTGHCFTPRVHIKKSIDLFGESQACQALGIEVDQSKKISALHATGASLLRISPIAYFYSKHSPSKRREIVEDFLSRMFGKVKSIDVFLEYLELLVNALNGLPKEQILSKIDLTSDSSDPINEIFFQLKSLLINDENDFHRGINLALKTEFNLNDDHRYLNPLNSDRTILLTLYLQIGGAIYETLPPGIENIYAKETLQCLTKWIIYQKYLNLHSIE